MLKPLTVFFTEMPLTSPSYCRYCPEAARRDIEKGDEVEVDFDNGIIRNLSKEKEYPIQPFPEFMQRIIEAEGLVNYIIKNK